MKVLFLDIDGVLNSQQFIKSLYRETKKGGLVRDFCPIASSNLLEILVEVPDLKIVISSSWRIGTSMDELRDILHSGAGVPRDRVIDKTPCFGGGHVRGKEIQDWLDRHPEVFVYAILDDDSDMLPKQMKNFVHTSWTMGLMWDKAQKAISILSPEMNANPG